MNGEIQHLDHENAFGAQLSLGGIPPAEIRPVAPRSGGDLLRAMISGDVLPPSIMTLLGIEIVSVERGVATLRRKPGDDTYNPMGPVHGGTVAALLDAALGAAIQSALPAKRTYTTLDLKLSHQRPVTAASGTLTVVARALDVGEQRAMVEADLTDADGQLCATATMTCLLVEAPENVAPMQNGRTWDISDWMKIS